MHTGYEKVRNKKIKWPFRQLFTFVCSDVLYLLRMDLILNCPSGKFQTVVINDHFSRVFLIPDDLCLEYTNKHTYSITQ